MSTCVQAPVEVRVLLLERHVEQREYQALAFLTAYPLVSATRDQAQNPPFLVLISPKVLNCLASQNCRRRYVRGRSCTRSRALSVALNSGFAAHRRLIYAFTRPFVPHNPITPLPVFSYRRSSRPPVESAGETILTLSCWYSCMYVRYCIMNTVRRALRAVDSDVRR